MAAKQVGKSVLGELAKKVPKNQMEQFEQFLKKSTEYERKVARFPPTLPNIDWEYYRKNVREEALHVIKDFQARYEHVSTMLQERKKVLDLTNYFKEIDAQKAEVEAEVKKYIAESNERIKQYEKELAEVKARVPYDVMTMEEFCVLVPQKSPYAPCPGRASYWPFDADENIPKVFIGHDDHHEEPKRIEAKSAEKSEKSDPKAAAKPEAKGSAEKKEAKGGDTKKAPEAKSKGKSDDKKPSKKDPKPKK